MNWLPPIVPVMASTLAVQFEALFWYIALITSLAAICVYGTMLYFCIAFRKSANPGPTPRILGSTRLEIAWTILPTIVFFSFFAWGALIYTYAVHPPRDAMEIFIIGKQWMWKAQYPNGQRVIIGGNPRNMTPSEREKIGKLVLPVNRPVRFTMTSEDVIHSFGLPAFRSKMDVLPGRYTTSWHIPNRIGEYDILCDQYCGTWHSLMVGRVSVVSEQDFDDWLNGFKPLQGSDHPVDGSVAQEGQQLFLKLQCIKCHSNQKNNKAPVLAGIYGERRELKGGGAEIVDDDYILESILKPRAKIAQGYEPIMPSYEGQATAEELTALVAYIKSLRPGGTPDATDRLPAPVGAPTIRPEPKTTSVEKN
jgi:cytochrome c oxidase subunit 2